MAQGGKASVVVTFDDGSVLDTWTSCTFRDAFADPCGDVQLTIKPTASDFGRVAGLLAKGNQVRLAINGALQGRFLIQDAERDYSAAGGRQIKVKAHTPLITPYEGAVDPDLSLQHLSDVSVAGVVAKVLAPYGLGQNGMVSTDARSTVNALTGAPLRGGQPPLFPIGSLKMKNAIAHDGETAYAFLARIVTRLGACIRIGFDDTILIGVPNYNQDEAYTVALTTSQGGTKGGYHGGYPAGFPDADRFVSDVRIHETNAGQFAQVGVTGMRHIAAGDPSVARPNATMTAAQAGIPVRSQYRSTSAPFKPLSYKDKSSRDANQAQNVAIFELGMRAKDAYVVEGDVQGWISATNRIWTVDTVARVIVEPEGLDDPMWLMERTLHQDAAGGQHATLHFIPLNALILGQAPGGH